MKKTVNINLGGFPFTIDEDAYAYLENYLDTIEKHFSASDGCEDIISDIEYRICELFQERLLDKRIITMKELDDVIAIMGRPEDFGAEPVEASHSSFSQEEREPLIKTGKKLYRDSDHSMVAGVIAGLAAYFGIKHVLILRILWLFFSVSGGIGVIAYIILWAVVPKASTASDKLAMKGEPINVENIARTIEEEIDDLSKKISDLSHGLSRNKKKKGDSSSQKFGNTYMY